MPYQFCFSKTCYTTWLVILFLITVSASFPTTDLPRSSLDAFLKIDATSSPLAQRLILETNCIFHCEYRCKDCCEDLFAFNSFLYSACPWWYLSWPAVKKDAIRLNFCYGEQPSSILETSIFPFLFTNLLILGKFHLFKSNVIVFQFSWRLPTYIHVEFDSTVVTVPNQFNNTSCPRSWVTSLWSVTGPTAVGRDH